MWLILTILRALFNAFQKTSKFYRNKKYVKRSICYKGKLRSPPKVYDLDFAIHF